MRQKKYVALILIVLFTLQQFPILAWAADAVVSEEPDPEQLEELLEEEKDEESEEEETIITRQISVPGFILFSGDSFTYDSSDDDITG